ncbi:MAG TPA: NAD(P)H-quinone oxidoreductase [Chryseosolibacter sp.]|nr:NAD(P)H-quinone oxidoreductase [Chryseosolibacter sp.]
MKCIVITQPGPPDVLQLQQRETPEPSAIEVLIKVKAAGVNRPDTFQRKGNYPSPSGVPADIPGLEISGIVEKCGEEVTRWKNGDPICALVGGGGYAEYAVVHQDHCLPVPKGLNAIQAASLPETVFTVWHNVFERGALKEGEHLLVHGGSSGIGTTAIQLARAWGSRVSVTAGSEDKCQACLKLGANRAINYKNEDFEEVLKEQGVDVILDMVGGDYIPKNMRLLKPDGRLVFINAIKGGKAEWNALDIMRRRLTITGSTLRARETDFKSSLAKAVLKNVWPLIESGNFQPVIFKTFPLEQAAKAHELMESSRHIGKIVLVAE